MTVHVSVFVVPARRRYVAATILGWLKRDDALTAITGAHVAFAISELAHLNLLGDIPARHSGDDLLGHRIMHPTFGAVVDVGAGLAG